MILLRQAVFKNHHGRDYIGASEVRNVETFDTQGRFGEVQRLLDTGQGIGASGEVGRTLRLVEHQRVLRVRERRFGKRTLVTAHRDTKINL